MTWILATGRTNGTLQDDDHRIGNRDFTVDALMAYLRAKKIAFILRPHANPHVVREGRESWRTANATRSQLSRPGGPPKTK